MLISRLASAFATTVIFFLVNYQYSIVTVVHGTFLSASSPPITTLQPLRENLDHVYLDQRIELVSPKEAISIIF